MSIKSAERTLQILECVAKEKAISMRELRANLDIPRSSLHGLLEVLVQYRFLDLSAEGEYSIGLRAFEVGYAWAQSVNLSKVAVPILRELVDQVNQTAHIGVLDGTDAVYIMKQENASAVRLISAVGKRLPAHATSLGRVLLSSLGSEDIRNRYAKDRLPQMTGATLKTLKELIKIVDDVRVEGFCVEKGESTPGVTGCAAPIYDRHHNLIAALSIAIIDSDPAIRDLSFYIDAAVKAAAEISAELGAMREKA